MGSKKEDDEGTTGGDEGGAGGKGGQGDAGGILIPSYYDLLGLGVDVEELAKLSAQALFDNRVSIKSKGYEVTALSKLQQLRNRMADPKVAAELSAGGGPEFADHPELEYMGGEIDPSMIDQLPESEVAERASNDPKLQNKLRNRLSAKLGMSRDVSLQAMQEEYRKKMEMRIRPAPGEEPRPRYTPAPKPRPY